MRYFDKLKKSKKKLRRRRFDDELDAGEEADSAYWLIGEEGRIEEDKLDTDRYKMILLYSSSN